VAAETFAATRPDSNDKLRKDVEKVRAMPAKHRYVFYLSPVETKRTSDDVVIVRLAHASMASADFNSLDAQHSLKLTGDL
jgi:hypothetical protein